MSKHKKYHMPVRCLLSILLCVTLCLPVVSFAEQTNTPELTGIRDIPLICGNEQVTLTIYTFDNEDDIPFIIQDGVIGLLRYTRGDFYSDYHEYTMDESAFPQVTFYRDNNSSITIDYATREVLFIDFDTFFLSGDGFSAGDMLGSGYFSNDSKPQLIARRSSSNFVRKGYDIALDLKEFQIPFYIVQDEYGMMPLQTFNDLFLSPYGWNILFNGEIAILTYDELERGSDLYNQYYSVDHKYISPELARFNRNELSMALQLFYGLKEKHAISDFDELFEVTGLGDRMLSTDPSDIDNALLELVSGFFGDMHSSYSMSSPYCGLDNIRKNNVSTVLSQYDKVFDRYRAARNAAYPDGVPSLEIVNDTLYITFDNFRKARRTGDYYLLADEPDFEPFDTISLIIKANRLVKEENSPIRNIVLDLSENSGGNVDAAIYVLCWMLGDVHMHSEDTLTDGQYSIYYTADVNLDREFTSKDDVSDLNLYCLTSPISFSCGNTVPALLKASGIVTLLGQTTGGGACIVSSLSTAIGTLLTISDNLRVSTVKNGAFYDIDLGVDPDIVLTRPASFYDREGLTDFINNLK